MCVFLYVFYFSPSDLDIFHLPWIDPHAFDFLRVEEKSYSPCYGPQVVGLLLGFLTTVG